MQMLKITVYLTKYIDLMCYDKLQNSLPFLVFTIMYIFVQTNIIMAVVIESDNFEIVLLSLTDSAMMLLSFCSIIYRNSNTEQAKKLLVLIGGDINGRELQGRDELRTKIINYCDEKRKSIRVMLRNLVAVYFTISVLIVFRNNSNNFSSLENESTKWPTPFLSYTPPELQSTILLIYTYCLHVLLLCFFMMEGFFIITSVLLATERVLGDFGILYILLEDILNNFSITSHSELLENNHQLSNNSTHEQKILDNLKEDMKHTVYCHQLLSRNFRVCAEGTGFMISVMNLTVMLSCCCLAYLTLMVNDFRRRVISASIFVSVVVALFSCSHNGQLIFNQNEILRQSLATLPWSDKPEWFKQSLHMMMMRANVDIEMKPYGVFVMNYMSFKDVMKTIFSIGNILYTMKQKSHTQY